MLKLAVVPTQAEVLAGWDVMAGFAVFTVNVAAFELAISVGQMPFTWQRYW